MGSFSIWHLLLGGLQFVVVVAVVGVVAYFLLRKAPAAPAAGTPAPTGEGEAQDPVAAAPRSTAHKVIAIAYLVGGLFGVITTLPQLNGVSLGLMSALAWLILLAQIAAAIYGGWQFWNHRPIGAQLLYWLSWSCVPVISFSLLSYWCAMGLALFPTVALGPGHFGTDFSLRFGYDSELWLNPGNSGLLLGVNVVALLFVSVLTKLMREAGIPKWPLVLPNA
jgi:hypothetical protein